MLVISFTYYYKFVGRLLAPFLIKACADALWGYLAC